jgi:hypothetical protein
VVPEVLRTPVGFSFFLALVHHYVIIRFIRLGQRQLRGKSGHSIPVVARRQWVVESRSSN